jgi:hypothetical protein
MASKYWFHWPRMLKMPTEIGPGLAVGIMIWKSARVWEQPSTNAASWTAAGRKLFTWKNSGTSAR